MEKSAAINAISLEYIVVLCEADILIKPLENVISCPIS